MRGYAPRLRCAESLSCAPPTAALADMLKATEAMASVDTEQ